MKKLNKKRKSVFSDLKINKYTIEQDVGDFRLFNDLKEVNQTLKDTEKQIKDTYDPFTELHQDLFASFYKYDPQLTPENHVDYSHLLNHEIMKQILESQKYKELRVISRLDPLTSTISTEAISEDVIKLINELKEQYEEMMQGIEEAQQAMKDAEGDGEGEGPGEGEEEGDEDGAPGKGKNKMSYEEAQKRLEEFLQKPRELIDKTQKQNINKMLEKAMFAANEAEEMIANWGLGSDPNFSNVSYQEKMKLLNRLRSSEKLQKIARMAGRYKRLAMTTQKEKTKRGIDSLCEVRLGSDLNKILASEKMKLADPDLEYLVYKDMMEHRLLQYEYEAKEKKQRGPIVCCIDNSGSMSGDPEIWSKAVAMGLLEIAKYQKRPFVCLHFSSEAEKNIPVIEFPKNAPQDMEKILQMVEYFSGGGTEFEPVLNVSQSIISDKEEFSKSDIIFITDGEAPVRDKWLKDFLTWKKIHNVKLYSVLVDVSSNSLSSIKEFSDMIERVSSIASKDNDDTASSVFGFI